MNDSPSAPTRFALRSSLSRRTLLSASLTGAALRGLVPHQVLAHTLPPNALAGPHLWLLHEASDYRPSPPAPASQTEIVELLARQAMRTDATDEVVRRWGDSPSLLPWTDTALDLIIELKPSPPRAARALALVHAALSDTVVAVRDAKRTFDRAAPARAIPGLVGPAGGDESSFVSEQAAVAGAAATVLGYLFPEAEQRLAGMANDAAESRLWAGASYRSDIEAGLILGQAVGRLAIARGKADASDLAWDGLRPATAGTWKPTPPEFRAEPLEPLAGTWDTWVLPDGAALRPAPPSAWGTIAWRAELRAVQAAVAARTPEQAAAVHRWAGGPGTVTPAGLWVEIARELIVRDRLDSVRAGRTLALTTIAMSDGFVCCWDAKFAYWTARPITADPSLDVLIPTPPFPSYTSGHSTISAAAATVLGGLFPNDTDVLAAKARQAKDSRLWAGIHFPADNETGATGGRLIGRLVLAAGGAESVAAPLAEDRLLSRR